MDVVQGYHFLKPGTALLYADTSVPFLIGKGPILAGIGEGTSEPSEPGHLAIFVLNWPISADCLALPESSRF